MSIPCRGHLDQLFHVFVFLRNNYNTEMVFDPSEPEIDQACFEQVDWYNTVYGDCSEGIPQNLPKFVALA